MAVTRRIWLVGLAGVVLAACGDSSTGPPPPTPGTFDVAVSSPNAQDQAWLVTVGAQLDNFTPAAGFEHYRYGTSASTTLLIVAASPVAAGETVVGSFTVTDVSKYGNLTTGMTEAAAADFQVRGSLAGYTVRVLPR
jgi:hypothetical protein